MCEVSSTVNFSRVRFKYICLKRRTFRFKPVPEILKCKHSNEKYEYHFLLYSLLCCTKLV